MLIVQHAWILPSLCQLLAENVVFKFLSVNSIVIAPASTGRDKRSNTAVSKTDQTNNGVLCRVIPIALMLRMVVMKLIEETRLDVPAR